MNSMYEITPSSLQSWQKWFSKGSSPGHRVLHKAFTYQCLPFSCIDAAVGSSLLYRATALTVHRITTMLLAFAISCVLYPCHGLVNSFHMCLTQYLNLSFKVTIKTIRHRMAMRSACISSLPLHAGFAVQLTMKACDQCCQNQFLDVWYVILYLH